MDHTQPTPPGRMCFQCGQYILENATTWTTTATGGHIHGAGAVEYLPAKPVDDLDEWRKRHIG